MCFEPFAKFMPQVGALHRLLAHACKWMPQGQLVLCG